MEKLIYILITLLVWSCNQNNSGNNYNKLNDKEEVIKILEHESVFVTSFTDVYDSMEIVPLKTKSPLVKIEKIFFKNDNMYIWDNNHSVWGFKSNGDSLFCINKQGKGPDEYIRIDDVSISDLGNVNLLDVAQHKLLKYDVYGEFIESKKFEGWVQNYCHVNGYEYLFSATPNQPEGYYIDVIKDSKKIESYFPTTHFWFFDHTSFLPVEDSVFFTRRNDDRIYYFKNDKLDTGYYVDFGHDEDFMKKLRDAKSLDKFHEIHDRLTYKGDIHDLSISDTYLTFHYSEALEKKMVAVSTFVYNKRTKKGLSFKSFGDSSKEYFSVGSPIASDGHYFYALIKPWRLDEAQRRQLQELTNFPIEPNLNPLLCRFLIKI